MALFHRATITPTKAELIAEWAQERVPVDGFELAVDDATASVLRNDRFELTLFRRPRPGPRPPIGLTATWDGQRDPVVLVEVRER